MSGRALLVGLALSSLGLGCASPAAPDTRAATGFARLAKGLTTAQVRALLGNPSATKPFTAGATTGQIWSYPLKTKADIRSVAVATQEVPSFDPLTGRATTTREAIYREQAVQTTDTLHLLIVDDRVLEWRVVRQENGGFN